MKFTEQKINYFKVNNSVAISSQLSLKEKNVKVENKSFHIYPRLPYMVLIIAFLKSDFPSGIIML